MRGLDDTDEEILQHLLEDSRKPYSEIAEAVGLSPPAVSDRVERLQEIGLIQRFTLDLNRKLLRDGQSVLVTLTAAPGTGEQIASQLQQERAVEHVFRTVDDTVVFTLLATPGEINSMLKSAVAIEHVREYDVQLLGGAHWNPTVDGAELAPECIECGNTVTAEGERERIDGILYHFCCPSCLAKFQEQCEQLQENA